MAKRIGIHLGTTGGASNAVERAPEIGANTFQIFSASPRMWRAPKSIPRKPSAWANYAPSSTSGPWSSTPATSSTFAASRAIGKKSIAGFRGEIERALILGAEYLVLHPGSWKGLTRDEGLKLAADSIKRAIDGLPWQGTPFHILIENTAGAEFSLGGSFEQVAELVGRLKSHAPVAVCLDTCHTHVAGYDIVSSKGYEETMTQAGATVGFDAVRVWHCNDAKAACGSKLDRHEHIGQGTMGLEPFRRLLNDPRFDHCAFIAETPVDEEGDEERNVRALKRLAQSS